MRWTQDRESYCMMGRAYGYVMAFMSYRWTQSSRSHAKINKRGFYFFYLLNGAHGRRLHRRVSSNSGCKTAPVSLCARGWGGFFRAIVRHVSPNKRGPLRGAGMQQHTCWAGPSTAAIKSLPLAARPPFVGSKLLVATCLQCHKCHSLY